MLSKLSSLAGNLSEVLHCDKCIDWQSYLDYIIIKDDQLIFRCFKCKKSHKKDFNKLRDLQIYMNFVIETLINLFCY